MNYKLAFAALALTAAMPVTAQTIAPVSVVASDTFSLFGQYKAENLINGSGLSAGLHDANFANMWMTNLGVNQASLTFDLGKAYNLTGTSIWTYNFGNPGEFQSTILRGVKDFRLFASTDGLSFEQLLEARLSPGTGQPLAAQDFTFAGVARFVRFDILNNHGEGTYAERDWSSGLSEVRFAGAAVPEPASWALMIAGFAIAGAGMRRRPTPTVLA